MATESAMELLFLDTFKHQSAELTNVDVVRFPYGVHISEVRIIPPGVRAHSGLSENKAYGETSPHAFQLDLFFNNVSKPTAPVFDRLGSLDYDENKSIIFRPNGKVNTDGLVLRGWYSTLTLAVYGSVEKVLVHDRDSSPPPPPPPPPPQQPGLKRGTKHDWDKEDQYNDSPPRPQPRGPRTPPGPPPPDDDEEETVSTLATGKEDGNGREEYFEPISPDRTSIPPEEPYSDEGDQEEDPAEDGEEDDDEEVDGDEEEEDDVRNVGNLMEDEEEEDEEDDEGEEDEEEEEGEGDDGYEQISSDEDVITDLEHESYKFPTFDMDYRAEDFASVPSMQYDPYEREIRPLLYFNPPYRTKFEIEIGKLKNRNFHEDSPSTSEPSAKLTELLDTHKDDWGVQWVVALEELPCLLVKGLSYLQAKEAANNYLSQLVEWTIQALSLQVALSQPIALNVRQLKAGTKLASSLAECDSHTVLALLESGITSKLFELLFAEHVSSSLKLNTLKSLDSVISFSEGMQAFLNVAINGKEKNGYQNLVELILLDQTVRVVTAGTAILQKAHFFEMLSDLQKIASQWAEKIPGNSTEREPDSESNHEKVGKDDEGELEAQLDMDHLLASSNISEYDLEKLLEILDEILHLMETAPHTMVQPLVKSFPTTARITGPPERDDPYPILFRYMHSCHFLESLTLVLSIPAASVHPGIVQAVKDLLKFLSQTQKGLLFLLSEHDTTNLLMKILAQILEQDIEEGIQSYGAGDDTFAMWLLQALHTLQCVAELFDHFSNVNCTEEGDSPDLLGTLHNLYLISFNTMGRSAVSHVFSLDQNFSCLATLLDQFSKEGLGDAKLKKSVTYNYACMLILLVVQSSNDVRMLEQYASSLLKVCKADENNPKLQELSKWLEPLEKLRFEISCIPNLIECIKQNLDNLLTLEGAGLMTALRVLCHITCPPPAIEGQQKDLKWNLAMIQLFSAEGIDTFIKVLQKLNSILLQPWRLHGNMGTILQRLMILSVAGCTLRLLKCMLTELLRGGSFEFKDTRVPSTLVTLHMILCSVPVSGRLDPDEQKIQNDIVDILLTFTQGVNEQVTDTEETLANNTWSLMLKEILSSVLKAPEGFFSGLALLSELLPLPLPMQTTQNISSQDIAVALNTRKLWSMHLHVHAKLIEEIVCSFSGSACQPVVHMLRRVCVQLCDLASPTALLIMRTVLDLIMEEIQISPEGKEKVCSAQTTRLFALLDSLASHRSCKVAILHLISGASKGDEKYPELFQNILGLLQFSGDSNVHQQHCAEFIVTLIQSLCDQDIALIVASSLDGTISETEQLASALPSKDLLCTMCDSMLELFSNTESSYTLLLTSIRTMMFLTEHDYGFFHLKSSLKKHNTAIYGLLKRVVGAFNKDAAELVSALLDFLRQILNTDSVGCCANEVTTTMDADGNGPTRLLALSPMEIKQLLQWKLNDPEHLLLELEKQVMEHSKDDERLESLLENTTGLRQILEGCSDKTASNEVDVEPLLPVAESIQSQFNNRTVYVLSDVFDDQIKALWFSPFQTEEIDTDLDVVKVDLVELSEKCCSDFDLKAELERSFLSEPTSPGRAKAPKGFKLGKHKHETYITSSGKSEYIEPAKRAHIVPIPRGRGRGGFGQLCRPHDIFRQRKQNTSRPPSMHVDDFVAAEIKDIGPATGLLPAKRTPKGSQKVSTRGVFSGNRGGRGIFHSQARFFTPPLPKVNYSRREVGRGSSWSALALPVAHRVAYSDGRGGQSNFSRAPPPSRQAPAGAYRLTPRDRVPRGRGAGPSWLSSSGISGSGGSGGGSRGKFSGAGSSGSRGRHVRSFTR
ncbi:protein virilizer homolog isoform X1 [Polypterus senegalus]|uniref:protein virilizer homolog isoform X1 n=1 Tax=Polypterus senegalus TaxID=55291 RepID=UPI00196408FD|nr:protein virilizer homolog isoform X1 [Polypterus senegalus]